LHFSIALCYTDFDMKGWHTVNSKTLRALTYSRVSTADKQNPEVQTIELRRYCESRGWDIIDEVVDRGFSGGSGPEQRPGLSRLITLVRARKADVIVVTKLDRLFRSLKHLVTILDELESLKIMFVSVGDQIDLTTASGRLMMQIVGAFSEFERSLIRERTIAGLAYVRSKGVCLGRPKTRPDDAILRLRNEGLSYTQIGRRLGCKRSAIYRALKAMSKTQSKTAFQLAEKTRHRKGG